MDKFNDVRNIVIDKLNEGKRLEILILLDEYNSKNSQNIDKFLQKLKEI